MIVECVENDKHMLLEYVLQVPALNIFTISNIQRFQIGRGALNAWIQYEDETPLCVITYCHNNVSIYSHSNKVLVKEIVEQIEKVKPLVISGELGLIEKIVPYYTDYEISIYNVCELVDGRQLDRQENAEKASVNDCKDIAKLLDGIKEFENFKMRPDMSSVARQRYLSTSTRICIAGNSGRYFIIRHDDKIIASASTSIETQSLAFVNNVATDQNFRSHGYASKVLSALCSELLAEGKRPCLLFKNIDAGRIYYRLGFKDVCKLGSLNRKIECKEII